VHRKHFLHVLLIGLVSSLFAFSSEQDLESGAEIFRLDFGITLWAILIGIFYGALFRIDKVSSYIKSLPLGEILIGIPIKVIGIGILLGSTITFVAVYLRFQNIALLGIPMHIMNIAFACILIYEVSHYKKNEI